MTTDSFPKRSDAQAIGERGVAIVTSAVQETFRWGFRRTPQESDFGVDGYIDMVTPEGYVTGKALAVQIKTGKSYFVQCGPDAWLYRGEIKHVNYYLNLRMPVLLLLVDPDTHQIWWRQFEAYEADGSQESWTIPLPKDNLFAAEAKGRLESLAGSATDYLPHLQEHWMLGERVKEAALVCIQVAKFEIESLNVRPFAKLFERLSRSRETVLSARHKVDFFVDGYNDDPRSLFEIPEVVRWIEAAVETVTCLPYFLHLGDNAHGIVTILSCLGRARRIDGEFIQLTEKRLFRHFLEMQFDGLNKFTEKFALGEEVNREVSVGFGAKLRALLGDDA
jgi:hypothetical protein